MIADAMTPADRLAEAARAVLRTLPRDDSGHYDYDGEELRVAIAAYDARKRVSESDLARATYSAWLPHLRVGMAESDAAWLDVSRAAMRVMCGEL